MMAALTIIETVDERRLLMTSFQIYIWLKLDSIHFTFFILSLLFLLALIGSVSWSLETENWFGTKLFSTLTIIFVSSTTAIPTTKEAAIIFGVPVLIEQAKDAGADKIPTKLVEYLNTYLDSEIKKQKENVK